MADDLKPSSNPPDKSDDKPDFRDSLGRFIIPPFVNDPDKRNEKWGLPADENEPGDYIIELNLAYEGGLKSPTSSSVIFTRPYWEMPAGNARLCRFPRVTTSARSAPMSSAPWWRATNAPRTGTSNCRGRVIYKVWPDFPVYALIDRSTITVKSDAAIRAYDASGDQIVWAVIDSGISGDHVHFGPGKDSKGKNTFCNTLFDSSVAQLHRDFVAGVPDPDNYKDKPDDYKADLQKNIDSALVDDFGHGTHVAGIIAGGLPKEFRLDADFNMCERVFRPRPDGLSHIVEYQTRRASPELVRGVAPQTKLVSLKVLDGSGRGSTSNIMLALKYIREDLNDDPKLLRVHGVNLSLGYEFDAEMFACGQSPLCVEVDRLVKSGVVVVVAAGNTGYGQIGAAERFTKIGISNTINDPGNAALAITVGSTHRDSPHTYGVSFFSSKGPTGDGRLKPDLVAPGERITSAATVAQLKRMGVQNPPDASTAYIDDSGTSMAAPHVSGTIAAFLSIRREFVQRPDEVKKIFLESATPLGRERYFEGHGLVDLMRAIQSV